MNIFGLSITWARDSKKSPLHLRHKRVCEAKRKLEERANRKTIALAGSNLHIKAYKLMTVDLAAQLGLSEEQKKQSFEKHLRAALAMQESQGFVFPLEAIPCLAVRDERRAAQKENA